MRRRSFVGRVLTLLIALVTGVRARIRTLGERVRRLAGRVTRAPADLLARVRGRSRAFDPDEPLGPGDLAG